MKKVFVVAMQLIKKLQIKRSGLLLLFLFLSASLYSQITVSVQNQSIRQILKTIERNSDYQFFYNDDLTSLDVITSLVVTNSSIESVMSKLLNNTDITYKKEKENLIVLTLKAKAQEKKKEERLISGTITDENDEPVIGANVVIDGTTQGTITDFNGKFSFEVPVNATLRVTYIGYLDQYIKIGNKSVVSIVMKEDSQKLDEVVVVGYGTQKKVNLTGSVASVNVEEKLQGRPISNISSGLSGLVAGLDVRQSSGQPGKDDASINIRGVGTLNNSSPMILIDGIIGSLNDVNPNDIESVSVLKDASSASIYGSRAANGVILITTKKGNKGRIKVSYSGLFSRQEATNLFDVVSDYPTTARLTNEGYNNISPGSIPVIPEATIAEWEAHRNEPLLYPNTNWLEAIYNPTWRKENNVSINGGNDAFLFNVGLGFLNNEGILKGTGYDRYNIKVNLESQINKWIKVGLNSNIQYNVLREAYESGYIMACLANSSPSALPVHPDGRFGATMAQGEDNQGNNMLAFNDGRSIKTNGNKYMGKIYIVYEPIKNLVFEGNYALNNNASFTKTQLHYTPMWNFQTESIIRSPFPENILNQITNRDLWQSFYASAKYDFSLWDKHNVKVLTGFNTEKFRQDYSLIGRGGMPDFDEFQINLSTSSPWGSGWAEEWSLVSWFARLNYDYMGKYLLEVNVRSDGSSRFSEDYRWGTFPSFSLGWRASEEKFLKDNARFIDNLKFRVSYGTLGNNNIGNNYTFANVYGMGNGESYVFGQNVSQGAAPSGVPNKSITWEKTKITNFGIDFGFLKDFDVTFDVFKRNTEGILITAPLPGVLGGLSAPYQNLANVKNKGWELSLNYHKNINPKVSVGANFNISHVSNIVTKYRGGEPIISGNTIIGDGYEYGAYYGFICDGIFRTQEDIDNHAKQKYGNELGDLIYRDLDNNGTVDDNDRTVIGKSTPDYVLGLNLTASYRNFDFSALFQSLLGYQVWGQDNWDNPNVGRGRSYRTKWLGRWTPENINAELPRLTADYQGNTIASDFWLQNANYVRLKNVQIGYTFPKYTLFQRWGVEHLRLFVSGENLLTFTKYDGLDPETASTSAQRYDTEIRMANNHPNVRQFTFGLNLTF